MSAMRVASTRGAVALLPSSGLPLGVVVAGTSSRGEHVLIHIKRYSLEGTGTQTARRTERGKEGERERGR